MQHTVSNQQIIFLNLFIDMNVHNEPIHQNELLEKRTQKRKLFQNTEYSQNNS